MQVIGRRDMDIKESINAQIMRGRNTFVRHQKERQKEKETFNVRKKDKERKTFLQCTSRFLCACSNE